MYSVLWLLTTVIDLYVWVLILSVIMSWLINFNVVNTSNKLVYMIYDALTRLTEPALGWIRNIIPPMGGLDISPIILILGLEFLKRLVVEIFVGGGLM